MYVLKGAQSRSYSFLGANRFVTPVISVIFTSRFQSNKHWSLNYVPVPHSSNINLVFKLTRSMTHVQVFFLVSEKPYHYTQSIRTIGATAVAEK